MTHGARLSYAESSSHFLALFLGIASRGQGSLPIFSGDLSVALRQQHRVIKDMIERHFRQLQQAYGGSIQVVRYKRRGGCRAMRGYLLPFQAAVQVLLVCEGVEGPLLAHAEVLHLGLIGGGPYQALLNWSAWQGDSSLVEEISEKEVLMVYWTFAKAQYLSNPSPSFRAHREPSC